jgi:Mrp family chromosome partitioning ATPase
MSQVRPGVLIAIVVFALFAAYAFLAPATYRTNAVVVVDSANPAATVKLPEPLEAARRLSEGVLDRSMLDSLSRERAGSAALDARARAAGSVRQALQIDTSDAHTFSIGYLDSDKVRAQRACNQLAHHAVDVAPLVLLDRSAEYANDLRRQQQTQELAAFLALHPQVASEAVPSGDRSIDKDPVLSAFHAEKNELEHRIADLEGGRGSDNPYVEPAERNVGLLKRRLLEIDAGLLARREALDAKPAPNALPPVVLAEWKRLLELVTQSTAQLETHPAQTLVARLISEAPLPGSPLDPNRPLLLFFGLAFGTGLGSAYALVARAARQRRTKSSRPPPVAVAPQSQMGLTVQLPAAPALPSGLGPQVPTTPPKSNPAPPIVPIPQRQISSSPPGPGLGNNGTGGVLPSLTQYSSTPGDEGRKHPSSNPPAVAPRRFASTLVLPPAENPTPTEDPTPDPVLASAAQAWDQQIRAHDVPGFAIIKPGSEPPGPPDYGPPNAAAPIERRPVSSAPAVATRRASRPPNQMKVTQPLGSFFPDGIWDAPPKGEIPTQHSPPPRSPLPPRSPSPAPESRYSYVSTAPSAPAPTALVSSSRPPPKDLIRVQGVPSTWRPDPALTPQMQRPLCEQLYPFAVENCFVLTVVSVAEANHYKSRVAAELALALAESGHPRILLLEADFHRPWVQRMANVDVPMGAGFSQQLRHRMNAHDKPPWRVLAVQNSLHVLAEGVMRMPGLILSNQFAEAVRELRSYYDFIVLDGPTASLDVDSKALDAVTDGIVTVCPAAGSRGVSHLQQLFGKKRFSAFASSH